MAGVKSGTRKTARAETPVAKAKSILTYTARLKPRPDTCLAFGHALAPEKYFSEKVSKEIERNHTKPGYDPF
jgi:hypothetical protein